MLSVVIELMFGVCFCVVAGISGKLRREIDNTKKTIEDVLTDGASSVLFAGKGGALIDWRNSDVKSDIIASLATGAQSMKILKKVCDTLMILLPIAGLCTSLIF